ncbi:MAG: SRPBCC family protein [Acidimicrobiales bacterium]
MASVRRHIWIDSPADNVWALVSDVGSIADWFPSIDESSGDANSRVCIVDGNRVVEDIVTNDHQQRRLQYVVSEGYPVEHHLATVDVIENDDGCLVVYSTDVKPDEMGELVGAALEGGLGGLKATSEAS